MHVTQEPYRELYDAMMDYKGADVHGDLVRPWLQCPKPDNGLWPCAFAHQEQL